MPNADGKETSLRIYPLPRQKELNLWITCTGGKERFAEAGAIGANVLTALLFQSAEELADFDAIILLAGHSSVGSCEQALSESFANHVSGFVDLVHKLRGQNLLFASRISVDVRVVAEGSS